MKPQQIKIIDTHNATIQEITGWAHYFNHHVSLYLDFVNSPDYNQHFKNHPNQTKTNLNHKFKEEIKLFTNLATELKNYAGTKSYQTATVS